MFCEQYTKSFNSRCHLLCVNYVFLNFHPARFELLGLNFPIEIHCVRSKLFLTGVQTCALPISFIVRKLRFSKFLPSKFRTARFKVSIEIHCARSKLLLTARNHTGTIFFPLKYIADRARFARYKQAISKQTGFPPQAWLYRHRPRRPDTM